MNILESALNSVAFARQSRTETVMRQRLQADNRSVLTATYAGVRNGRSLARYPNGGIVPINPISNGAIERGRLITLNMRSRGTPQASWMPR